MGMFRNAAKVVADTDSRTARRELNDQTHADRKALKAGDPAATAKNEQLQDRLTAAEARALGRS